MAAEKDEEITDEKNEEQKEEVVGFLPFQSPFLLEDLAVIPEDLQELETLITENSHR